ncbi:ATP synthase epsilon chain [Spirochaetia bacterium]|nr:ATP synthase epsilon chain [Spirochaetia bacterium]GHU33201.1 ATP synthase epsilon chain [Spirochaetia bacterium]
MTYPFQVHTPHRPFYADKVEVIILTLIDGEIAVYANHSFFIAPVQTGILKIKDKTGTWRTAFISEGMLEVKGHNTILLVDAAEWPEEIDLERSEAAKKSAEARIKDSSLRFETDLARAALKRAEFRIKVKKMENTSRY